MTFFLTGPTGVGKTSVGIELALAVGGEIISADSMQVYRGMDIGTAKPTLEERCGVPHHLLDILDIAETCDVSRFCHLARTAIQEVQGRNRYPIVTGGSGMYLRALVRGIFEGPGRDEKIRSDLESLESPVLYQKLLEMDPLAAKRIHPNDRHRMVRAIEYFMLTGAPISDQQTQWKDDTPSPLAKQQYLIGLMRPREELYLRCDQRVNQMFERGLMEEVRSLMNQGLKEGSTAGRAIGYAEVMEHLQGERSLAETMDRVRQHTRNFAKRQLTWFRRETSIQWLELTPVESPSQTALRIKKLAGL